MVNFWVLYSYNKFAIFYIYSFKNMKKIDKYLRHNTISSSAFFIFKNNISIVVGFEIPKAWIVFGDPSIGEPAGSEHVLRDVGDVLLENEGRQFARAPSPSATPAWATRVRRRRDGQQHRRNNRRQHSPPPHVLRRWRPIQNNGITH